MNRSGKKAKRPDLLELSNAERVEIVRKAKEALREKVAEAKLWRSLETENVSVNGHSVKCGDFDLKGLAFSELPHAA